MQRKSSSLRPPVTRPVLSGPRKAPVRPQPRATKAVKQVRRHQGR